MVLHHVDPDTKLKLLVLDDAKDFFELTDVSRNYLSEWLPWVNGVKTIEDSRVFIRSALNQLASNTRLLSGIWRKDKLVGCIELHSTDWSNRKTCIGYWLGEEYQGSGLMTNAAKGIVDLAFNHFSLNRVEIRVATDNYKSRAIPERLGFENEGCIRESEWLYDHFVDHIVYGMLAAKWESNIDIGVT